MPKIKIGIYRKWYYTLPKNFAQYWVSFIVVSFSTSVFVLSLRHREGMEQIPEGSKKPYETESPDDAGVNVSLDGALSKLQKEHRTKAEETREWDTGKKQRNAPQWKPPFRTSITAPTLPGELENILVGQLICLFTIASVSSPRDFMAKSILGEVNQLSKRTVYVQACVLRLFNQLRDYIRFRNCRQIIPVGIRYLDM